MEQVKRKNEREIVMQMIQRSATVVLIIFGNSQSASLALSGLTLEQLHLLHSLHLQCLKSWESGSPIGHSLYSYNVYERVRKEVSVILQSLNSKNEGQSISMF